MVKSCEPSDYPQFEKIPAETARIKAKKLIKWIWENDSDIPMERLRVSDECLFSIIDLVERRRVYFHVFHGINMSEWNEAALYCFWIAKLQPFFEIPASQTNIKQANEVNAMIAARLLCRTINNIRRANGKGIIGHLNLGNLVHSFRYRDISKESVMVLFENLISA